MPVQYQKDRNGQWKAVGYATPDESQPRELAAGSAEAQRVAGFGRPVGVQARLRGRAVVWAGPNLGWQSPGSFEKAKARGQLPKPEPQQPANQRKGLSWLANELTWVGKGVLNNLADGRNRGPATLLSPFGPTVGPVLTSVVGRQNMAALQAGAADNVLKAGEAVVQWATGKEVNPGQNNVIRTFTDTGYRMLGAKPPSQLTKKEQETDSTFRSIGINAAVSAAMVPLAPLGVGATVAGTALRGAGLFVGEQLISTALDDNTQGNPSNLLEAVVNSSGARVQVPGAVRPTDDWGEATRKSLIPNTVAAGLFGAALGLGAKAFGGSGQALDLPFTKRWQRESRTVSEVSQSRAWAVEKGLISEGEEGFANRYSPPEFVGELNFAAQRPGAVLPDRGGQAAVSQPAALDGVQMPQAKPGGAVGVEGQGPAPIGDVALEGPQQVAGRPTPPQVAEPSQRIIGRPDVYSPVQSRLQEMEAAGNPDTAAYQQWLEGNQQIGGIPTQQMEPGGGVLPGELPRWEVENGDPWVDPGEFNPVADPAKPETDAFVRDVWQLDDEALVEAAQGGGSAVESVQAALGRQGAFDPAGDPRFSESAAAYSTAPGEAIGYGGPDGLENYRATLEGESWSGLRALTDPENNPAVARVIQSNTGRDPGEFTRLDMVEGLMAQAERDGRFVIPRPNGELYRPGEVVLPVEDLGIDPSRFQFKGNVNPSTGEQLGASLDGIEKWNTDLEGTVSLWRDPADALLWTINGHNRVAAAKKLGVPTLPAKIYDAPDARSARAIGAAQNIATGQGTPVDAAKFMRDSGITDVAQLQQLVPGMPLKSGWAEQGLALSKLPDSAFNAVVQGDLSPARGAIIGGSGKTPQEMEALWKYAEGRNLSDRVLGEVVAMTAPDATAVPDALKQQTIWDVLGQDSPEAQAFNAGLIHKAKLSDRVRSLLAADRRLFAAVSGRGAAERLQAGAANSIDAAGSKAVADQASQVLGVFDRLKYQQGPIGDLLNQGVLRLDGGEKLDAVARAVSAEVADAMEKTMGGADQAVAGVAAGPAAGRVTAEMPTAEQLAWAESKLLSPRKLANRQKYKAEFDANEAEVSTYLDEMPGSNSGKELSEEAFQKKYGADETKHPQLMTKGKAMPKQLKELEDHLAAERILERQRMAEQAGPGAAEQVAETTAPPAVDQPQGPVRLDPATREQLQVELVQRGIDEDGLRPPSTPEPALFDGPALPLERSLTALENEGLVVGSDGAQAVADELRLAAQFSYRDAAMEKAAREGQRNATGYYELSGEERIKSGQFRDGFRDEPIGDSLDDRAAYAREQRMAAERSGDTALAREWGNAERALEKQRIAQGQQRLDTTQQDMFGVGEYDTSTPLLNQAGKGAINPEVLPAADRPGSVADAFGSVMRQMAESDARLYRTTGKAIAGIRKGISELGDATPPAKPAKPLELVASPEGMVPKEQAMPISPYGPLDLANREAPMPVNELVLPASLSKAAPRYGKAELKFATDLDRVAYMLSRDASNGASRSAQKFIRALQEAGLNPADVARYGREKVQPAVKAAAGGGAAPQKEGLLLEIPDQRYQGQVRLPASERQAMQAKAAALEEEIAAIDAEIARFTKKANDGGCL